MLSGAGSGDGWHLPIGVDVVGESARQLSTAHPEFVGSTSGHPQPSAMLMANSISSSGLPILI